jgi:hypothetical protein
MSGTTIFTHRSTRRDHANQPRIILPSLAVLLTMVASLLRFDLRPWDVAGYLAAGLVAMAFCMKDMTSLRIIALASNVAFLIYGIGLGLVPVWLLHAILLPVNAWRLREAIAGHAKFSPLSKDANDRRQSSASFEMLTAVKPRHGKAGD